MTFRLALATKNFALLAAQDFAHLFFVGNSSREPLAVFVKLSDPNIKLVQQCVSLGFLAPKLFLKNNNSQSAAIVARNTPWRHTFKTFDCFLVAGHCLLKVVKSLSRISQGAENNRQLAPRGIMSGRKCLFDRSIELGSKRAYPSKFCENSFCVRLGFVRWKARDYLMGAHFEAVHEVVRRPQPRQFLFNPVVLPISHGQSHLPSHVEGRDNDSNASNGCADESLPSFDAFPVDWQNGHPNREYDRERQECKREEVIALLHNNRVRLKRTCVEGTAL